ncbi:MAG: GNAT family N-acetyltransferase [Oscillospiraceae bacterium]
MVDFATQNDYEDIAKVWRISFSDTDSYIKQFWDAMFKPENTLVYRVEGVAVAMYFSLEAQTVIKGRCYSTYYLYAAATLPKYRGRGYMAQLIEKGIEVAQERKVDFIVLVPAEDYLFDYYAKFGFATKFNKKSVTLTRKQLFSVMQKSEESNETDLFKIRQVALAPYDFLNWGSDALNYAAKEHIYTHGSMVKTQNGYAMYTKGKDTLYIKELCSMGNIGEIFYLLLKREDAKHFVLNLPVAFPMSTEDTKVINVGMIRPINENAKNASLKMKDAFIGLSLG